MSSAPSSSPKKQRAIYSEVLRQHDEEDVRGCCLGPGDQRDDAGASLTRQQKLREQPRTQATQFKLSAMQRNKSVEYLEKLKSAEKTKVQQVSGVSQPKAITDEGEGKQLDELYADSALVKIGTVEPKVIEVHAHAPGTKPRKVREKVL